MSGAVAPTRYNAGARALHWAIAVLVLVNLAIGFGHELFEGVRLIPIHKSIGLTVLALTVLRIAWRLGSQRPSLPLGTPSWETAAAHSVHAAFYGLMIALPLSGWLFSSAGKYPLSWFGLFELPKFAVAKDSALYALTREGHEVLGLVWIALIVLHVAAALRHHFVLRDGVLRSMA